MIRVAITLGDAAGIGPETIARALTYRPPGPGCSVILVGVESIFRAILAKVGVQLAFPYRPIARPEEIGADEPCYFLTCGRPAEEPVQLGRPTPNTARLALAAIDEASKLALAGRVDAVVTGPVSKQAIAETGTPFTGHTEYLAALAGVRHTTMMFAAEPKDAPALRVSFVTTHAAVRKLPALITMDRVLRAILATQEALKTRFGIPSPKIAVLGLNPHSGEGGMFGREEKDAIAPAVVKARAQGVSASGPYPADTVYWNMKDQGIDAIVAMFHDQALPLVKAVAPEAVNITLGLPYVRTSPDHGPAFDIAGQGKASWKPTAAAIHMAARLVEKRLV